MEMRNPNCNCIICDKPLYRGKKFLSEVRFVTCCIKHRTEALKLYPPTEKQLTYYKKEKKKVERIERICEICGSKFYIREKELLWSPGRFCSNKCYAEWKSQDEDTLNHLKSISNNSLGKKQPQKGMKLDKNPAWKGGMYIKKERNYTKKYVRCPDEYKDMAKSNGYVMEHRLVMAKSIGRCLDRFEVVHHIDHDTTNNNIDNLMLFKNNKEHKLYEAQNKC